MIYRNLYITDCARQTSMVFPIVVAFSALIFLSRLLAETVASALPVSSLWQFLMLTLVKYAPQFLIISLFAGTLLALGRAYHYREMDVWFAAGIGLRHFVMPGVVFTLPAIVAVMAAAFVLSPWAVRTADTLRAQLLHDINPQHLRAGEFSVTPGGVYTYFSSGDENQPDNIFIARSNNTPSEIITTRAIRRERGGKEGLITLLDGTLYRLPDPSTADTAPEITAFERLEVRLPLPQEFRIRTRAAAWDSLPWNNPRARAELIWRINQPLAALFFAFLAPLVGGAQARRGTKRLLFIGLLLFVIYNNLLYFVRDAIAADNLHVVPALMLAPLAVLAAALLLGRIPAR